MLRKEDCKPGVEVIAIKNVERGIIKPVLVIGAIYTIETYKDICLLKGKLIDLPNVRLVEIALAPTGNYWCYDLECFKLRDKEEFTKLFELNNIPQSLRDEAKEIV